MTLRRKTRWLLWSGLFGGLLVAVMALVTLHTGLVADREDTAAALATMARRQAAGFAAMAERGEMSLDNAQRLARSAVMALSDERFQVRIVVADAAAQNSGGIIRRERLPAWDWAIVVNADTADVYGRVLQRSGLLALLLSALLVLNWRASRQLFDRVVDPVEGLAARMRLLSQGGTGGDIPGLNRPDEIGTMARALDGFRRTLREFGEREERLRGLLASVDEAIVIVDSEGRVRQANGVARRLLGDEVEQTPFIELFATGQRDRVAEFIHTLRTSDDEATIRHDDTLDLTSGGQPIEVTLALTPLALHADHGFVAVLGNLTEQERSQRELMRLATRDRLTGLANRTHFETALETAIDRAWKSQRGLAVLCFDLSRFKLITDSLGHRAGDALLLEVARRLRSVAGREGLIGRLGIDDFAVLLDPADTVRAGTLASAILGAFDAPIDLEGTEHFVRPAVGYAQFPQHATTAEDLVRCAETALYTAKRRGGLQATLYEPSMGDQARRHLALDQEMRRALGNGEFLLHYQPKVSLVDFSVEGFEALLRWNRPGVGLIAPGEFLGVAEDTGFIAALDEWVLDEACRQVRAWIDEGLSPLQIAVNCSPHHLRRHNAGDFERALARHRVPASLIEVEVTENAVMQDMEHALKVLEGLQEHGISVAVDDFGTGHSSLSYLKQLPVSTLKIDRSFIAGLPKANDDAGIVSTIISMADILKLKVVAEGVERPEQAQFLRHHNCILVQGWLTGRPIPAVEVPPILATRQRQRA